ncbi:hypothetical protein C5167_020312 [Papaver somniferum]|uniref:Uncharacterized protein n=1 Tax=Papaver somniferum TaxID=3469 RepID=A0A4Y7IWM6_PAPSO|nr:hypothetical protein C5167_020312 [Papaver somniferum]
MIGGIVDKVSVEVVDVTGGVIEVKSVDLVVTMSIFGGAESNDGKILTLGKIEIHSVSKPVEVPSNKEKEIDWGSVFNTMRELAIDDTSTLKDNVIIISVVGMT